MMDTSWNIPQPSSLVSFLQIVFAYKPLIANLHPTGVQWLFGGGIAYTVGAIIYSIHKIPGNHAIFHVFVCIGSFCHFMAVYLYVWMPIR